MFKIITLFALLYFLISSGQAESGQNDVTKDHKQEKRHLIQCSGQPSLNEKSHDNNPVPLAPKDELSPVDNESTGRSNLLHHQTKEERPHVKELDNHDKAFQAEHNNYHHSKAEPDSQLKSKIDKEEENSDSKDEPSFRRYSEKTDENPRDNENYKNLVDESELLLRDDYKDKHQPDQSKDNYLNQNELKENELNDDVDKKEKDSKPLTAEKRNENKARVKSRHHKKPKCQAALNNRRNNEVDDEDDSDSEESEENAKGEYRSDASKRRNQNNKFKYFPKQLPLGNPESNAAVVPLTQANGVNLYENKRVCYACTSATNPTCLSPDRRTTVKYCLKGHEACVTKTFQNGRNTDAKTVIRDCGISCDDTDVPGPQYKTCQVCHSDVCNDTPLNGAFSIQSQGIVFTLFLMFIVKYSM